jgi:nitroreductase
VLIRRRRSAQSCDGATPLTSDAFHALLDHLLPRAGSPPWGVRPGRAHVHLVLFVHRVTGLSPGLYALPRDPAAVPIMREAMRGDFVWERVADIPAHIPLFGLLAAPVRDAAERLACLQPIAADGAFSVAMLAEFDRALEDGPWGYRAVFHEAGLVGQALYLGAEAAGLQGTGIGCFFDDALHELFGLADTRLQVIYQFTVGKAVLDRRIADEPPYAHLKVENAPA